MSPLTDPRSRRTVIRCSVLTCALVALSCGRDSTSATRVGPPAQLTIVSGDAQTGTVGKELSAPLIARAIDANGRPIDGQVINFKVTAGGGSVFAGTAITNVDGIAQERWTLGNTASGEQAVEARAVDSGTGLPLVFAIFHATAIADLPAALTIVRNPSNSVQSGHAFASQPVVQLTDKYGNPSAGIGVQVSATIPAPAEGRTLVGTTTVATDSTGTATFTNLGLLGSTGTVSLSFSASGLAAATSNAVMIVAGTPTQLLAVSPTTVSGIAGRTLDGPPRVVVRDAAANAVPNVSINFAVSTNGGSITPTSVITDSNGEAAVISWTLPRQVGSAMVVASASAIPDATITFTATVAAAAGSQLARTETTDLAGEVGTTIPVSLRVTDEYGNAVGDVSVTFAVGVNSGSVSAVGTAAAATATATSDPSGLVNVSWTLGTTAGQQTLMSTLPAGSTLAVAAIARPGPAAKLVLERPPSTVAKNGAPFAVQPIVSLTDRFGNSVTQAGVVVSASVPSPYVLVGTSAATTDALGRAPFERLGIGGVAGPVVVSFTGSSVTPVAVSVQIAAGAPANLAVVSGDAQSAIVGTSLPIPFIVRLSDGSGNVIADETISWTTADGGTLDPSESVTNANGEASTILTLGAGPGTNHVVAVATNAVGVQATFTAVGSRPPPAHLTIVMAPAGSFPVGTALSPMIVVKVTDNRGAPLEGVPVGFASVLGGGSITPTAAMTDATGQASAQWVLGTSVGRDSVTVTVAGLPQLGLGANAVAGPAVHVSYVSGNGQTGVVGHVLAQPLVARVTDQYGNVLGTVTWESNSGPLASVAPDGNGNVRATWTPTRVGSDTALAIVASDTVFFSATVMNGGSPAVSLAALPSGPYPVVQAIGVVVVLRDANGTAIPGATINWEVTAGMGAFNDISNFAPEVRSKATTTDASGQSSVQWYPGRIVGLNTVTASADGANPLTLTITSVAGPTCNRSIIGADGNIGSGMVGTVLPAVLKPTASDKFGNSTQDVPPPFGVPGGGSVIIMEDGTYRVRLGTIAGKMEMISMASYCYFNGAQHQWFTSPIVQNFYAMVIAGPAVTASIGGGDEQTGIAGTTLGTPLTLRVTDQYGNLTTADVLWTVSTGGGTIAGSGTSALFTLGTTTGQQSVEATVPNIGVFTFHATAIAGPAFQMRVAGGDSQSTTAGTTLASPLMVLVTDQYGNPTSGVTVTWTVTGGGGTITGSSVTDADGHASAQWTLGSAPGTNTATASVNGTTLRVAFTATAM